MHVSILRSNLIHPKCLTVFCGIDVLQSNPLALMMFPIFYIASNVDIGEKSLYVFPGAHIRLFL